MSSTEHHLIVSSKNQLVSVRSEAGRKLVIRGLDILKQSASLAAFVQNEVIQEPRILKLRSLIDKGEIEDAFYLAEEICFAYGRSTASETREAMETMLKLARTEHVDNDGFWEASISLWYNMGKIPFPRDWEISAQWAQLSADKGLPLGEGYLSWLYFMGRGVPQDFTLALKYYLLSKKMVDSQTLQEVLESYGSVHGATIDLVKSHAVFRYLLDKGFNANSPVFEDEIQKFSEQEKSYSIVDRLRFQEEYNKLKRLLEK
jgi:TPR repeat protein